MKWRPRVFYIIAGLDVGMALDQFALRQTNVGLWGLALAVLCFFLAWTGERSTST